MGMTIGKCRNLTAAVLSSLPFALSASAIAGPITLETQLVFDGTAASGDTPVAPRLGADGIGNYVVFQLDPAGPFGFGPGIVMQRRLDGSGAPDGSLLTVSSGLTGDTLPDASGQWVVYLADLDGAGAADQLRLRDLSTGNDFLVSDDTSAGELSNVRVGGDTSAPWIVWSAGDVTFALNVSSIGTGTPPTTVRGPIPATGGPEIDSRFIVWAEQLTGLDSEIRAQEIGGSSFFVTPDDLSDGFDEIDPATWGDLIAFGLVDTSTGLGDIVLADILADTTTTFDLDLEGLSNLALSAEFLTFSALDGGGISQAFLLRIADGALLQLTDGPEGGGVADIFGDLVAWTSGEPLFVAKIGEGVAEVPLPPALAIFGLGLAGLAGLRRRTNG